MLWMLMVSAWAAVPTASGIGELKWGQTAPTDYDGCVVETIDVPLADLFGVAPTRVTAGFQGPGLDVVFAVFAGLAQGDAIEAAITRQLGKPFEPYRGDLYWTAASGFVSVRMARDQMGSAFLAITPAAMAAERRGRGLESDWWMVTADEMRQLAKEGYAPGWPMDVAALQAMSEYSTTCGAQRLDDPNTVARTFEAAMGGLAAPAPRPGSSTDPRAGMNQFDAQERALLDAARIGACGTWQGLIFGACKRAKRELAAFDSAHGL